MAFGYPWYAIVEGDEIEQGDIFESCPVFLPSADLGTLDAGSAEVSFRAARRDVIVLTQSCDLAKGREKASEVLVCPLWVRSQFVTGHLSTAKGLEDARRGNLPNVHVLAASDLPGTVREVRIVDFRRLHTLPIELIRRLAVTTGERLRLLPPYREHFSQAFARSFMRVGLPADIPPFR